MTPGTRETVRRFCPGCEIQFEDDHDYQGCMEQRMESDAQQRGVVDPTLPSDPTPTEDQARNPQGLEPPANPEDVNHGPGPTPAHPGAGEVGMPAIMCTKCLFVGNHIREDCPQDPQSNPPLVQLYEAGGPELKVELLHVIQGTIPCRVCGSEDVAHEHQVCFRQATFYFQDNCLRVDPFKICKNCKGVHIGYGEEQCPVTPECTVCGRRHEYNEEECRQRRDPPGDPNAQPPQTDNGHQPPPAPPTNEDTPCGVCQGCHEYDADKCQRKRDRNSGNGNGGGNGGGNGKEPNGTDNSTCSHCGEQCGKGLQECSCHALFVSEACPWVILLSKENQQMARLSKVGACATCH